MPTIPLFRGECLMGTTEGKACCEQRVGGEAARREDREPVLLCWSGGKDCALALRELLAQGRCPVAALLTTLTEGYERVSMHGVRRELLHQQADSLGLPLAEVWIPPSASNEIYAGRMAAALARFQAEGVCRVAFGDLFLADIRRYREENLARAGLGALFPLWGKDTAALAREFLAAGFRARVTCVDTAQLDGRFAGREYDAAFLSELPAPVDPCGENGEFHTFVFDGPPFRRPVPIRSGETVLRDGRFRFHDLLPGEE